MTLTPSPCLLTTGEINKPAPFLSKDISHLLPPSSLPHRVPQGLLYLDVLQYSDELMGRLVRGEHVEVGSSEEVEIRGCSIWAVEVSLMEIYNNFCFVSVLIFLLHQLLKQEMLTLWSQGSSTIPSLSPTSQHNHDTTSSLINSVTIDFYLWNYAKQHSNLMDHLPIHRTLTIFY